MAVLSRTLFLIAALLAMSGLGVPAARAADWGWPLAPPHQITRRFDPPDTPYGAGHRGVDLAGSPGQSVFAAGPGKVGYAGWVAGRGVVTVMHSGGLKTTYEPVDATVKAGQRIALGAVLGHLMAGHPGCPVAACLHWGLLRGSGYLDPLSVLGAGRVRLLPLATPGGGITATLPAYRGDASALGGGLGLTVFAGALARRRGRAPPSPSGCRRWRRSLPNVARGRARRKS